MSVVFDNFVEAFRFIVEDETAEDVPLIAFRGYEIDIFAIEPIKEEKLQEVFPGYQKYFGGE